MVGLLKKQNPTHDFIKPGNYTVYLTVDHDGILLGRNMTIEVVNYDIEAPSDVNATINNMTAINASYRGSQNVTLVSSDNWGEYTIYYTVDGSDPINSTSRRVYYEPVQVDTDTELNFVAVDPSGNWGNVGTLILNISDAIVVNETLVEEIQKMLDEAEEGSKIVINYDVISGANFTINKPLNIITTNNTLLIGNGVDPVFRIGENASGTTINGFKIENVADGILVNNTSNVSVLNTFVTSSYGTGINIQNSSNTLIKDTTSNDSYVGLTVNGSSNTILNRVNVSDAYQSGVNLINSNGTVLNNSCLDDNGKSSEGKTHNLLLSDCNNTVIENNYIANGYFGIHLSDTNINTTIRNNTIYETVADGILFEGFNTNFNVTLNTIDGSFNGMHFNGYSKNISVTNNLVWNMHPHDGEPSSLDDYHYTYNPDIWDDLHGQAYNCVQVSAGSQNFGNGVYMENNVFIKQSHRSWESRHTSDSTTSNVAWDTNNDILPDTCSGHDYNLWDGSGSYSSTGGAVGYTEGRVNLVVDRIGDSTFRMRLMNMRTGEYLTDIDPFTVTVTAGTYTQTVNFTNDSVNSNIQHSFRIRHSNIQNIYAHLQIPLLGHSNNRRIQINHKNNRSWTSRRRSC